MTPSPEQRFDSRPQPDWSALPDNHLGVSREIRAAVDKTIAALDSGNLRVVEQLGVGQWVVNPEAMHAVLIGSKLSLSKLSHAGSLSFFDSMPTKFEGLREVDFLASGVRIVPPAVVQRGAFLARGVVVLPAFVCCGAYIDEGSMIDSWASIGSCAQIGKNVHVSVGASIGGALQSGPFTPVVVESNCFVGAGAALADGVLVEEDSVIAMGVILDVTTPILDRSSGHVSYGRVPAGSVLVAGSLPSDDGKFSRPCAVIAKRITAQTRAKTSINELLRL